MLCWTLGITEHHNAVDNVLALINLALLTGHVGRYGSGLNPLRGQNNVQGGGDMGAFDRLPGFQHVENAQLRVAFEHAWGTSLPAKRSWHLSAMFEAMARGELTALYVIGENPAQSEADAAHAVHGLEGLEHLVVQDIFLTATAERADVVLPAAANRCEAEGTVTNDGLRARAPEPPAGTRVPGLVRGPVAGVCYRALFGTLWGSPRALWRASHRQRPRYPLGRSACATSGSRRRNRRPAGENGQ